MEGREEKPKAAADAAESIYKAYPRKVGKGAALKAIRKALTKHEGPWLLARVKAFAASPAGQAGEFTPHPATWFNQARYDDDDAEWNRGKVAADAPEKPSTPSEVCLSIILERWPGTCHEDALALADAVSRRICAPDCYAHLWDVSGPVPDLLARYCPQTPKSTQNGRSLNHGPGKALPEPSGEPA